MIAAYWTLAVILRESDKDIGYRGLFRFNDIDGQPEVELCYRIAKKYWDRGLATETATALRDISLEQFALKRPISLMDPDNRRSIRVAEKVGMVHTADVMLPGYTHPDRVYPCTRTSDNKAMQQTRDKAGSDGTSKVASR